MITADYHVHTSFSGDCDAPMEDMLKAAINNGLETICITEHMDLDYPITKETPEGFFSLDAAAYRKKFLELSDAFAGKINMRFGVEMGLQPHINKEISDFVKSYPFDFVIGSSHLTHGIDLYYPSFYEGRPEEEAYREYFESILENLEVNSDFDVYGHIDYAVRYGPNQNKYYSYNRYSDVLEAILRKLTDMGKGIEVNTKGLQVGLGEPNPCIDIIRRYRELGGEIITCGSDAHSPDYVGYKFDVIAQILTDCGFKYYTEFKNRIPEFKKIQ